MDRAIGKIGNHHGQLVVKEHDGKCFCGVENYGGFTDWQEIPKSLFDELVKYDESLKIKEPSA